MAIKEKKLAEAAPIGSFNYISEKINYALANMDSFDPDNDGDNDKYNCYIVALFPDRVVISCEDSYYEMTYSIDTDGNVTFGDPTEVEQYFTATESGSVREFKSKKIIESSISKELKECGIEIIREAQNVDFESGYINARIKEGSFDAKSGEVEVVIIEAGTNDLKKRHYPISTIREAAPIFTGMKMYINHQTDKEERERPERDLRDWVSTVQESNFKEGAAIGRVYIHDAWLRERMSDPVFAKNVGLSINTGGKISYGKINGQEMQIVEKINPTRSNGSGSVDWVTEAGARGRVVRPIKESATQTGEEDMKKVAEMTLQEFQTEFPEVYKKIQESGSKKEVSDDKDEKLAEANRVIEDLKKKNKLRDQKDVIASLLNESKLPEVAKSRITDELQETVFESDDKLKEALGAKIKKELDYINSFSGKGKIKVGAGANHNDTDGKDAVKEAQATIEDRFNLKKKKSSDDDDDEN